MPLHTRKRKDYLLKHLRKNYVINAFTFIHNEKIALLCLTFMIQNYVFTQNHEERLYVMMRLHKCIMRDNVNFAFTYVRKFIHFVYMYLVHIRGRRERNIITIQQLNTSLPSDSSSQCCRLTS